jgi:hypothetical protein
MKQGIMGKYRVLLFFVGIISGGCCLAAPPDTLFEKAGKGDPIRISAEQMEGNRHINLEMGKWEGATVFKGNVRVYIGDVNLLCDSAIENGNGYCFLVPMLHINNATVSAEYMLYDGVRKRAILKGVILYRDGTHHHDYLVIDFMEKKD